jgi:RNA polymerase sigma factor (sigma-70 family)
MKNISFKDDVLPLKNELYRLALRITLDNAEAQDVVQETMIKVWNKRDSWQEIESIEAFTLTICRNIAIDHTKRKANQDIGLDDDNNDAVDHSSNPYEELSINDRMSIVKKLIDGLPEKQRTVMQLRDFEGKSYKDIATVLDISEEQVKISIFRARQRIKQQFQDFENYGL